MLRELLDRVMEIGEKAHRPCVVNIPGEPAHIYHVAGPHGCLTRYEHTPSPADHKAHTLEDLAKLVADHSSEDEGSIWIAPEKVVYVFGKEQRCRASFATPHNPQIKALKGMNKLFEQKELISFLRIVMAGTLLTSSEQLLDVARTMKWKRLEEGESIVTKGSVSVGKAAKAEVQNASNIPDEVNYQVRVYENPCLCRSACIRQVVDLDTEKMAIRLATFPGEVEEAVLCGQQWMKTQLQIALRLGGLTDELSHPPIYLGKFNGGSSQGD